MYFSRKKLISYTVRYPILILFIAMAFSVIGVNLAIQLDIETDFAELIPDNYESVKALERMRSTLGGEGSDLAVGILSPDFEASKAFAEDLIEKAMNKNRDNSLDPYFGNVEYRRETSFMRENALYFATFEELDELTEFLQDEKEQARLEANPFYVDFFDDDPEEDEALQQERIDEFNDLHDWLIGSEYPVHADGSSMTLRFFPTGSQSNVRYINRLYGDMERLISDLSPESYHPEMETVLAGRLMHRAIQVEAIRQDVAKTFGIGVSAVLLLVLSYFFYKSYRARAGLRFLPKIFLSEIVRLPALAILIALPLMMSLSWTFGLAYLLIGNLNMMTSTLALLLFGLGVDFAVHFFARYSEQRSGGQSIEEASTITFMSTGKAITAGAITTSFALFVLIAADFRGFSEFGIIAGIGILFAMVAMTIVMPALIVLMERWGVLKLTIENKSFIPDTSSRSRYPASRWILGFSLVSVVVVIVLLPRISFEYDFDKLDPSYPEYESKKAIVDRMSSGRRGSNPAYIITDSRKESLQVAEKIRQMMKDSLITTVSHVNTLQDRYPLEKTAINEKLLRIDQIRNLLDDTFLKDRDEEEIVRLRKSSQTRVAPDLEKVPAFIRDMFVSRTGEVGNFVMIYPSVGLSDGRNSIAFARDIGRIELDNGEEYHAGSTSIIAADMLILLQKESPWMVIMVILVVMLIMWYHFRSIRWSTLAFTPLLLGMLWMLLIVELTGLSLNFFNLVVLPAMLGIGNDDGIHLVHRYREEGPGSIIRVLKSTGEHCTVGTLTTMIGFFGLLFSFHPGLKSIGQLALIGVFTILLASLVLLPALIQFMEDNKLSINNN